MAYSPSHILELTRALFRQEAEDLLMELDTALLELEAAPADEPSINRAFRPIHTLKGSGATAGFSDVSTLLHDVEDVFNDAREGRLEMSSAMIDLVLRIADLVRKMTAPSQEPGSRPELVDQGKGLVRELKSLAAARRKDDVQPKAPMDEAATPVGVSPAPIAEAGLWSIRFVPTTRIFHTGTDPLLLLRDLLSLGPGAVRADTERLLAEKELDPELCYLSWEIQLATNEPYSKIKEVFVFVEDHAEVRIEPVAPNHAWVLPACAYFESSVVRDFRDEAEEDVAEIESRALGLEERPGDVDSCEKVRRSLHNLKGVCGLLLSEVRRPPPAHHPVRAMMELCHAAESFLESTPCAGTDGAAGRERLWGLLLETVDWLKMMLRAFDEGTECWPEVLLKKLGVPETSARSVSDASSKDPGALEPIVHTPAVHGASRTVSLRPSKPVADVSRRQQRTVANSAPQQTVRVEQSKLDRLMRAVGELLVAKNSFPVLAERARSSDSQAMGKDIKETGDRIAHIADDLQDATRQIRMMPIRTVFQRFPRMIRDLARSQNKQVQLILSGEETELDKTVLEQISDPLVHLIRNAVDHGIEPPEVRVAAGKPAMGTVGLEVVKEGSLVVLRISDDGRGMDPERLRAKAVQKGFMTEQEAARLAPERALELIFLPGLSTAEKITDISGRGVGMDVVQSNIRQLHGSVTVASEGGQGSTLTIKLPSSLMVSKGILVECATERLVLPIEGIRQMVKIRTESLRRFQDILIAGTRGSIYPVFGLAALLGFEPVRNDTSPLPDCEDVNAAIVSTRHGDIAVVVDRLIAEIDVIVKPLTEGLDRRLVFQGATILGDGTVALILDLAQLASLIRWDTTPEQLSTFAVASGA